MAIVLKKMAYDSETGTLKPKVIAETELRCSELFMEIPILNIVWFLYLTFI